jgi:hypothetical protein
MSDVPADKVIKTLTRKKVEKTDQRHDVYRAYAALMDIERDGRRAREMRLRRMTLVK